MVSQEAGQGLEAECWFCDQVFVKTAWHPVCQLWICPFCLKCGCDLDPFTKQAIEKTYRALT